MSIYQCLTIVKKVDGRVEHVAVHQFPELDQLQQYLRIRQVYDLYEDGYIKVNITKDTEKARVLSYIVAANIGLISIKTATEKVLPKNIQLEYFCAELVHPKEMDDNKVKQLLYAAEKMGESEMVQQLQMARSFYEETEPPLDMDTLLNFKEKADTVVKNTEWKEKAIFGEKELERDIFFKGYITREAFLAYLDENALPAVAKISKTCSDLLHDLFNYYRKQEDAGTERILSAIYMEAKQTLRKIINTLRESIDEDHFIAPASILEEEEDSEESEEEEDQEEELYDTSSEEEEVVPKQKRVRKNKRM